MVAFDNHHVAWMCDLKFGEVVLVTRKYSELSVIIHHMRCYEDLVENLFPEVILTRLMDCRIHRLFHFIMNRHLNKSREVEFPFKVTNGDDGQDVLEYTGDLKGTPFHEMKAQTIEFPSVVKVLKLKRKVTTKSKNGKSTFEVRRRVLTDKSD